MQCRRGLIFPDGWRSYCPHSILVSFFSSPRSSSVVNIIFLFSLILPAFLPCSISLSKQHLNHNLRNSIPSSPYTSPKLYSGSLIPLPLLLLKQRHYCHFSFLLLLQTIFTIPLYQLLSYVTGHKQRRTPPQVKGWVAGTEGRIEKITVKQTLRHLWDYQV